MRTTTWTLAAVLLLALVFPAVAADRLSVRVVAVTDGDTFKARVGSVVEVVRIVGLDAPERGSHVRCRIEADLAERAWRNLARLLASGPVELQLHGRDRYGRVLALVTVSGRDVAPQMVNAALARPYAGGRRLPWCPG